jgi:hypothetical protein
MPPRSTIGKEIQTMPAAQQQPELGADSRLYLFSLRLWIFCALFIVGFGLLNYVLNWFVGVR